MTRRSKCVGAACVFVLGVPGLAQIGVPAPSAPASIEVTVTDPDNQPIAGADVNCSSAVAARGPSGARQGSIQTGLDGKCAIKLSSQGPFRIAVKREGYLDAGDLSLLEHVEVVDVKSAKTVKLFVDLVHAASFQGTVYLEDGSRVAGATVRLQSASLTSTGTLQGLAPRWLMARTDGQGNYVFPIVPPSRFGMWIAPPDPVVAQSLQVNDRQEWTGYANAIWHSSVEEVRRIVSVEVAPGEDVRGYNIVLRTTRIYPYQGTLREWSGEPLAHAKIGIRVGTGDAITLLEPRPVNSQTGDFDLPALSQGPCWLLVYRDDAPDSPYSIPLELGEGQPGMGQKSRHTLRVPPLASVAAKVVVGRPDPSVAERKTSEAEPETLVEAARRRALLSDPAPVQVWLTPLENATLARGDTVSLRSSEAANWNSMSFPTKMLAPGTYQFRVQASEPWYVASAKADGVDLLENQVLTLAERRYDRPVALVIEIRHGGTALEGLVVNEKNEPLPSSAMCALAEEPVRRAQPGGAFCVRSDIDGAYRSHWLSPGKWRVWALTKRPHDNPVSPAFQEKYERQGRELIVPENGILGRLSLTAIE